MPHIRRFTFALFALCCCYLPINHADEAFSKGITAYDAGQYADAFGIWESLALGNHSLAQNHVGFLLANGLGVEKNLAKAALWYQSAAKNNNIQGVTNLAYMYEKGYGVTLDRNKALQLYARAAAAGDARAKQRYNTLNEKHQCVAKGATTKLFSLLLNCATRPQLRHAIKAAGALPMKEPEQALEDAYYSSQILSGSHQLTVLYTKQGRFARAQYYYPAKDNISSFSWVYYMISHKYGTPHTRQGQPNSAQMSYNWARTDGINISVIYHRKTADVTLQYHHPSHYTQAAHDFERLTKAQQTLIFQSQSNAF